MAEIGCRNTSEKAETTHPKKRKGFWSKLFRKSSGGGRPEAKEDEKSKHKGVMDTLITNARQAATKEVMNFAEKEAMKEVETQFNHDNNNGSQPTNSTTDNSGPDPSITDSDPYTATTKWAKRMANTAQQKVQSLQNLAS